MKDLKEFKYQHQLDKGSKPKAPRSRFDLYCGMLLGALAVGIIWPAATKWVAKESRTAHAMPAKKLLAMNSIPKDLPLARPLPSEKATTVQTPANESSVAKITNLPSPTEAAPRKAISANKEVKTEKLRENKPILAKKTFAAKPLEKKELRIASRSVPTSRPVRTETMMETEAVLTAAEVQAKTDATLLKNDVSGTTSESAPADESAPYITISAVQYDKSSLSNCKNRCLLKAKDAKGQVINAIVSGPSFADILMEHEGTINLTGKKSTIKKHEVFLVQSITFNLPDPKAGVANSNTNPVPKSSVSQPNKTPPPYQGGSEAYEDLGSDLAPR
jgi:hypothetical protein